MDIIIILNKMMNLQVIKKNLLLIMLFVISVPSVWGGARNCTLYVLPEGAGEVLIDGGTRGSQSFVLKDFGRFNASKYQLKCVAYPNDGWYFAGWSKKNTGKDASGDSSQNLEFHNYGGSEFTNQLSYYAVFEPVKVTNTSNIDVNPAELHKEYKGTITFQTTGADNMNDFTYSPVDTRIESTDGIWTFGTPKYENNTVTVDYTYEATRDTYKNRNGTRTDQVDFTLTSKGDETSTKTCTLSFSFPSLAIKAGTAQDLSLVNVSSVASGVATFPVEYVDDKDDFQYPKFASTKGAPTGRWTVGNWYYADNQVVVHYKFTGDGINRQNTATLTLSSSTDENNYNTCTVNATAPKPTAKLLEVTDNLSPVLANKEYKGTALFEVEHAATHAVSFGTPQGAGTWKILNSIYKETDAANGKGTVTVNYSYTTASDYQSRQNSNTLTLTLDGGAASISCLVTANMPNAAVLSATNVLLQPTSTSTEYPGTAVFEVQYADAPNLSAVSFGEPQGAGTWLVKRLDYKVTDAENGIATVTVNYSYTTASDYQSRQNSNTLTLTLDGGASKTCTITANLPAITIPENLYEVLEMTLSDQSSAEGEMVFDVMYADGVGDFSLSEVTDSKWRNFDMKYVSQSPSSGTLTVNYTFDNGGVAGDWTEYLTLRATSGATCLVTLRAIAEAESTSDIEVTLDGKRTECNWAEALDKYQKDGCKWRLLHNINLGTSTAQITKNVIIDLSGKTLSATLTNANQSLLYLNTAGVTLTITDSRLGGTINVGGNVAGALYAVQVNHGNLIWEKANIEINNITTGNNNFAATGIRLANQTSLTMTGGKITSRHTKAQYAYGIYADAGAKVTATGVTIDVEAKYNTYGVYAAASVNNQNGDKFAASLDLHNCNVTATSIDVPNNYNTSTYGVYIASAQNTITHQNASSERIGEEYAIAAKAHIDGGTYTAIAKKGDYAYAVGVANRAITLRGNAEAYPELTIKGATFQAEAGRNYAYALSTGGRVTVENATFSAMANNTQARCVYLSGGTFVATGSTISSVAAKEGAYGVMAEALIENYTMYQRIPDVKLDNVDVTALTKEGNSAYGVYLNASKLVQDETTFAKFKETDPYKTANDVVKQIYNEVYKFGEYAVAANAVIKGGSFTAEANGSTAHGISAVAPVVTAAGGAYAASELSVSDATIVARTLGTTTAYGIQGGGATTVERCRITAEAATTTARGIFLQDKTAKITDCEITATGTTTVSGIYANASVLNGHTLYVDLTAENNTVTATATSTTADNNVYGMYLAATAAIPQTGIFMGKEYAAASKAVITGGTYTATAARNNAYAISSATRAVSDFGKAVAYPEITLNDVTCKAVTGTGGTTRALNSGGKAIVNGGVFTAQSATSAAAGLYIQAGTLEATDAVLNVTAGTTGAYGVYLSREISEGSALPYATQATLNNLQVMVITAEEQGTTGAYGVYGQDGVARAYTDATFETWCKNTKKIMNTDGTIKEGYGAIYDIYNAGYKRGEFVDQARSVTVNGGTYNVTANTGTAYGIYVPKTIVSLTGKHSVSGELVVNNATITATAGTTTARGIYTSGPTIIDDCNITATASADNSNVRGVYVYDKKTTITNSTITVTGKAGDKIDNGATGIYLDAAISNAADIAGWKYYGELESNGNIVTATTTEGANATGLYLNAISIKTTALPLGEYAVATNAVINGGSYTATAKTSKAKGISMGKTAVSTTGKASASGKLTVRNANIQAKTNSTIAYGIETSGPALIDNCTILALAGTNTARGIHINDSLATITNSTITAQGTGVDADPTKNSVSVYGIYADASIDKNADKAGWKFAGALESKGNTITATAFNGYGAYGLWLHADVQSITATGDAYRPSGDYAVAASAVLDGDTYKATASAKTAYALAVQEEKSKNEVAAAPSIIVNSGKFWGEAPSDFADINAYGLKDSLLINDGYFRNNTNVEPYIREGYSLFDLPTGTKEYGEGYRYFIAPASASGTYVCEVVGQQQYKTLEEALQFVNLNPNRAYTIRMLADYTLPAGDYVLPANASLLIPYAYNQTALTGATVTRAEKSIGVPYPLLTLTFESGTNFTVFGKLEASAIQAADQGGAITGAYGHLHLRENARIDLEKGATMYAWGFVTGAGLVNAKADSKIYEFFQLGDWKGGSIALAMVGVGGILSPPNKEGVFPLTHYFYQNIETEVVYHLGAKAYACSCVSVTGSPIATVDNVILVGNDPSALFEMKGTDATQWVKKSYIPATDRTNWTLSGDCALNSLNIKAEASVSVKMNSADFVLPLSSNMTIIQRDGELSIMQDAYFMPGTELIIQKEATLLIPNNLYIIDVAEWKKGHSNYSNPINYAYVYVPKFTPTWGQAKNSPRAIWGSTKAGLPSAKIMVQGVATITGQIYTTSSGANICSTNEDAGKVIFKNGATTKTINWYQYTSESTQNDKWKDPVPVTSAKLHNENTILYDEYTPTAGAAANTVYNYIDGVWRAMKDGCLSEETVGTQTHYYAHPSDIVEVKEGVNHTYVDVATGNRTFINTENKTTAASCVWWEVASEPILIDGVIYYKANQNRFDNDGVYYYYDTASDFWKPKTVTITWKNYDGTTLAVYSDVSYNTSPKYLGATPTRQNTAKAQYAWTGWTDQDNNFCKKNEDLPRALTDMTYTACFAENKYQYTVTFRNSDGSLIESGLWNAGEKPVCSVTTPERAPTESEVFTFKTWQPAVTKVTGPAEYTAQYTSAKRYYTVTFLNYDGAVLYTGDFAYGEKPDYRGATPVRESNTAYSYTFSGWDKSFVPVPEVIAYTAQFTAKEREYGDYLDVTDWTADGTVLLNMNGYTSPSAKADWTVTADGIYYTKTDRQDDRILELVLQQTYQTDDEVLIEARGTDDVIESHRKYKVPHIFDGNATLGAVAEDYSSILFVRSGTLTVAQDANVAAIYVAPGAELRINPDVTLAAGKLVLRTEAFASAVFTNNGTLLCDNVFYSRIVSDNLTAYPLALPFAVDLQKVVLSTGKTAKLGSSFGLMHYDADRRASNGLTEMGANWVGCDPQNTTTMEASRGYQLISPSKYYYEYRFPVDYTPDAEGKTVHVTTQSDGNKADRGWNYICSPFTGRVDMRNSGISPEDMLKISTFNPTANTYEQRTADVLEPAMPFFYQTSEQGLLHFSAADVSFSATPAAEQSALRRVAAIAPQPTQWIRLYYGDWAGAERDETNLYFHPNKFTVDYDMGYDVVKLSKTGDAPLVYTSLACGDLAFAALPDSVAALGIPLTVSAPQKAEMYFSIEENRWLNRLQHLYLIDQHEELVTDLLYRDYVYLATAGVASGRFILQPVFKAPDVITDVPTSEATVGGFVAYSISKHIIVEQLQAATAVRCYDMLGCLIATAEATEEGSVSFAVPQTGVYFVHTANQVAKVIVR